MMTKRLSYTLIFLFIAVIFSVAFFVRGNRSLLSLSKPVEVVPPLTMEFVLMADTGSGEPAQFVVADAIEKHCKASSTCQAIFIAGDIIYDNGVSSINDPQFQTKFEQPYAQIDLPFYISYGNHDYLGCKECYIDYTAISKKWKMPSTYYVQEFGKDVAFFVIDSENFDEEQQQWLTSNLAASTASHKIVVGHQPIETYEMTKLEESWNGKAELEKIICHQAEMYVAGHAHILEDNGGIGDCPVRQLVVGGGGAATRKLSQVSDGGFLASEHGFAVLTVIGEQSYYAFFNDQGEKLFDSRPL